MFKWDRFHTGSPTGLMDGSRLSDFSIERILSPQLGHSRAEPQHHHHHGRFGADAGVFRAPAPVPLQYRGLNFEEPCLQCFHRPDFSCVYSTSGVHLHLSNMQEASDGPLAGYHGYYPTGVSAQAQLRQKARVRTVFTDAQTRQLEALFDLTDYPPVEARAEVAKSTGLSEETVRVWFKNRRARRKQKLQRNSSKVKSSPPCQSPAESNALASIL